MAATFGVLALVLAVFVFYLCDLYAVGAVLGAVAGATDYVDGWLARRTGQVTRLGEILDQFCDVALELAFLVFAITLHVLPVVVLAPRYRTAAAVSAAAAAGWAVATAVLLRGSQPQTTPRGGR